MAEKTTGARGKRTVAERLRALLAAEGYRPRPARDEKQPNVIHFKVEGNLFLLRCEEGDPDFVQVCTGYSLEDATQDELALLRAANEIGGTKKAVKAWLPPGRGCVEIQVELFLGGRPFTAEHLGRAIEAVHEAANEFHERVMPRAPEALA